MTLPKTAAQPCICPACINDLYSMLLEGQKPSAVYCSHNQSLAFITVDYDAVTRWRLLGPMSAEEAQHQFAMVDATRQVALAAIDKNDGTQAKH